MSQKDKLLKNYIRAGKVNTSEVRPKWCHACNSNTYVPEHRLHQKNKWSFFVRERNNLIFNLNTTETGNLLMVMVFVFVVVVFVLSTFRMEEFVVMQCLEGKGRKQWEAVICDLN